MSTNRLVKIEQRIERIKAQLTGIGDMRPGSLTRQYKDPESRSGPYYQLSYTLVRQSRTEYIRRESVADIRRQIGNYKRFKKLCAEWIALGIEHSQVAMKLTSRQGSGRGTQQP